MPKAAKNPSTVVIAPVPKILKVIGEESKRNGTESLLSRQIDRVIKAARAKKSKRRRLP
jgi:hypothetical protein